MAQAKNTFKLSEESKAYKEKFFGLYGSNTIHKSLVKRGSIYHAAKLSLLDNTTLKEEQLFPKDLLTKTQIKALFDKQSEAVKKNVLKGFDEIVSGKLLPNFLTSTGYVKKVIAASKLEKGKKSKNSKKSGKSDIEKLIAGLNPEALKLLKELSNLG